MRLHKRLQDGTTLAQHLQAAAVATGSPDERLQAAPPAAGAALWVTFCELSSARPAGMGAQAVPWSEIDCWQRLHRVQLSPWEADTLHAMDRAALAVMNEKAPS